MMEFTQDEIELVRKYHRCLKGDSPAMTVHEQVKISGILARCLTEGPAHFREQAEAKAAELFGETTAAMLVERKAD